MNSSENYIEQNTAYFSKSARNYDFATKIISPLRQKLFLAANAQAGDQILDIATGTGAIALKFASHGFSVKGVDLSKDMLEAAKSKKGNLDVEFIHCDASALPFADGAFDIATVSFALHDMPFEIRKRVLLEVNRILKPSGKFIIMDYHKPDNTLWQKIALGIINSYEELHFKEFIQSSLKDLLMQTGFQISREDKLLGGAVALLVCTKGV